MSSDPGAEIWADILVVSICYLNCKKASTKSKLAHLLELPGCLAVSCLQLLLDLSQSKRGIKLGWVLRHSSRGLADILDVGIQCLSCKQSSTKSKCASAGDVRVTCCELSQSLLDLSQTKRGMKLRGGSSDTAAEAWQTSWMLAFIQPELQEIIHKIQMCICWSCQGGLL